MDEQPAAENCMVSTHSRLKAAGGCSTGFGGTMRGFNTQPPEGGWHIQTDNKVEALVSTHSRLKAAGFAAFKSIGVKKCFNTQPPEGGWAWKC